LENNFLRNFIFREGQITGFGTVVFILMGIAVIYFSVELLSSYGLKILGLSLGLVLMGVGGLGARANAIGLRPFTNDPLGWRKAKASYPTKDAGEELSPSVSSNPQDRKQ
jgi:hypothetical protein